MFLSTLFVPLSLMVYTPGYLKARELLKNNGEVLEIVFKC